MSLDMYLTKKTYIVGSARDKLKITGLKSRVRIARVECIIEDIATWRKANAIHQWFVKNIQEGDNDCKSYFVSIEQLKELFELSKQVQKEPNKAPGLLPTQGGFLFGSTEYDSRYFQSIDYTVKVLEAVLREDEDQLQKYEYQSSW